MYSMSWNFHSQYTYVILYYSWPSTDIEHWVQAVCTSLLPVWFSLHLHWLIHQAYNLAYNLHANTARKPKKKIENKHKKMWGVIELVSWSWKLCKSYAVPLQSPYLNPVEHLRDFWLTCYTMFSTTITKTPNWRKILWRNCFHLSKRVTVSSSIGDFLVVGQHPY